MWIGACTSSIGTWMQIMAQSWLIYTLYQFASFCSALDQVLGGLPIFLFSLFGGVLADRIDRRHVLLGSQYVQMGCAFMLTALVAFHLVHVWHILMPFVHRRVRAGVRRTRLCRADSDAGGERGHAQRHRAELDPVQCGGDGRPGARRHRAAQARRDMVLRSERRFRFSAPIISLYMITARFLPVKTGGEHPRPA